jgi:hypothetical protein
MSKEIERSTNIETTTDAEGHVMTVENRYERVVEKIAKKSHIDDFQGTLKRAAREMRAIEKREGGEVRKVVREAKEAITGAICAEDRRKIGKQVRGSGKWIFEVKYVERDGVLFQILYNIGSISIKWGDLVKVIKEVIPRASNNVIKLSRLGLPINLENYVVREAEITEEGGKLVIFANVSVKWVSGKSGVDAQDVDAAMMEAGLL